MKKFSYLRFVPLKGSPFSERDKRNCYYRPFTERVFIFNALITQGMVYQLFLPILGICEWRFLLGAGFVAIQHCQSEGSFSPSENRYEPPCITFRKWEPEFVCQRPISHRKTRRVMNGGKDCRPAIPPFGGRNIPYNPVLPPRTRASLRIYI